jgi:CMP-N,N'-diacetyllegionaminic acid synthase
LGKSLKKNFIAIIPARSGSKSIKDKNIKKIGNIPLIAWSIKVCLNSKYISKVIVSTDSLKYAKIAKRFGVTDVVIRPKNISKDLSTDYEMIKHCMKIINFNDYDYIAHIRPTTPFRKLSVLNKAINFFKNSKYDSLRTIHQTPETVYKCFELSNKNLLKPIANLNLSMDYLNSPKENFKKTYVPNGYVDIYRKVFIKNNNLLFGKKVYGFITPYSTEIDSLEEYIYLKNLLKNNRKIYKYFKS